MRCLCLALSQCAAVILFAQSGFQPLFDGKSLDAFIVDTPGIWSVRDGVLTGTHNGLKYNDFLRTRKHYENFVLTLRFRLKNGAGNSGIQFRSRPVPNSHEVSGYQADIGERYWGSLYDESRRKRVLAQAPEASLGGLDKSEWNEYSIQAEGGHITLKLNGRTTVDYIEAENGIEPRGFIALQVHSGPPIQVEFKDLLIKELPPSTPSLASRLGPFAGDSIPSLSAPDQNGRQRDFASLTGPKGLFLVFSRSADWCVYCKTQLAELQVQEPVLSKLGYGLAALTYDSREILSHFAQRRGISYPLLSDPESKIIDAFGLRNETIREGPPMGVPHPAVFVIGADGRVEAKYFEEDYRDRITITSILTRRFGELATPPLNAVQRLRLLLESGANAVVAKPGQTVRLTIAARLPDDLHVYAPGAVADFIPVSWTMEPSEAWQTTSAIWPEPQMFRLFGSNEPVPGYKGTIQVSRDVVMGTMQALRAASRDGAIVLRGEFRFQACTDKLCYPPESVPLTWTLLAEGQDRERVPISLQRK